MWFYEKVVDYISNFNSKNLDTLIAFLIGMFVSFLVVWVISCFRWIKNKHRLSKIGNQIKIKELELESLKSKNNYEENKYNKLKDKIDFWVSQRDEILRERDNAFEEKQKLEKEKHNLLIEIKELRTKLDSLIDIKDKLVLRISKLNKNRKQYEIEANNQMEELNRIKEIYYGIKKVFYIEHSPRFWFHFLITLITILFSILGILYITIKLDYYVKYDLPLVVIYAIAFFSLTFSILFIYNKYKKTEKAAKNIVKSLKPLLETEKTREEDELEKSRLLREIEKLTKEKGKLQGLKDRLEEEISQKEYKLIELNDDVETKKVIIDGFYNSKSELEKKKQSLEEEIDEKKKQLEEVEKNINKNQQILDELKEKKEKYEAQIEKFNNEIESKGTELNKLKREIGKVTILKSTDIKENWEKLKVVIPFRFPDDKYEAKECSSGKHSTIWGNHVKSVKDIPDKDDRKLIEFIMKFPSVDKIEIEHFEDGGSSVAEPYIKFMPDNEYFKSGLIKAKLHTKIRSKKQSNTQFINIYTNSIKQNELFFFIWMCGLHLKVSMANELN